jgi:hypothetical protein
LCLLLYVSWHFSLVAFHIISLFSSFSILIMIRCRVVLFCSCLFRSQNASCMWMPISIHRVGKFSAMTSLNRFPMP